MEVDVALLIFNYSNVRFEILVVVNVKSTIFQRVAYNGVNMYSSFRGRVASIAGKFLPDCMLLHLSKIYS